MTTVESQPATMLTGAEEIVWDLTDLFRGGDDPALSQTVQDANDAADRFAEKYRGRVAELSGAEMASALEAQAAIQDALSRAAYYANLEWTTDTANPQFGALVQKMQEQGAVLEQKMLFFELEWSAMDDSKADMILNAVEVAPYLNYLRNERRMRPHRLSEAEEKILSEKSVTGSSAWGRLFSQTVSSTQYELDGKQLPLDVVSRQLYSAERDQRKKAADSITNGLKPNLKLATYIHNVLAADKFSTDKLRKFPTWITSRNMSNEASDESVNALVKAVTERYDIVGRYYEIKKRLLGLDELYDYDRYAPIGLAESRYTWQEARDLVLNAFSAFTPELGSIASEFFDKRWIHARIQPGKRGGAFASPVTPSLHPYVFVNYSGIGRDVMTLAHELGHGVHMYLSRSQKIQVAGTPLTTAETASVFGEFLVFADLMGRETDPKVKIATLCHKIDDSIATVFRQVSMNRFEDIVHTARREKGELTTEQLNEAWMTTQQAMFPGGVTLRDDYSTWWSYIPHFINTPGYVYAYAFGHLLVMALLSAYKQQGDSFKPRYIEMLTAGGSDTPENIVSKVGIRLDDPNFWAGGLNEIAALVDELEKLVKNEPQH